MAGSGRLRESGSTPDSSCSQRATSALRGWPAVCWIRSLFAQRSRARHLTRCQGIGRSTPARSRPAAAARRAGRYPPRGLWQRPGKAGPVPGPGREARPAHLCSTVDITRHWRRASSREVQACKTQEPPKRQKRQRLAETSHRRNAKKKPLPWCTSGVRGNRLRRNRREGVVRLACGGVPPGPGRPGPGPSGRRYQARARRRP
jgi:hypothetical protein